MSAGRMSCPFVETVVFMTRKVPSYAIRFNCSFAWDRRLGSANRRYAPRCAALRHDSPDVYAEPMRYAFDSNSLHLTPMVRVNTFAYLRTITASTARLNRNLRWI